MGLAIGEEHYKKLRGLLGRSSVDSILVAKERGECLFSDDLLLREVADTDWNVKGVWSQAILIKLLEAGSISLEQYHDSVKKLVSGN